MVRLIISDIDGTLVPEGSADINPEYMDVIRALTDRGIQFAAASGRQASSMDAVFHEIRDCIYYLADNGAYIQKYGLPAKEVRMDAADTKELINDVRKTPDCYMLLSTKDGFYTDDKDPAFHHLVFEEYKGTGGVVEDIGAYADGCIKLSLYCFGNPWDVCSRLEGRWKDRLSLNVSGAKWVDINDSSSSKGNAVRWLQESLGICPQDTAVFGDNFNDISMMERSVQSYASVLSHPDVKKAARYEVASYKEDGVLKILKRFLKEAER